MSLTKATARYQVSSFNPHTQEVFEDYASGFSEAMKKGNTMLESYRNDPNYNCGGYEDVEVRVFGAGYNETVLVGQKKASFY